jgi:hypothetical protein
MPPFSQILDFESTARSNQEAEGRARVLLRSWLSPEQLAQYDASEYFEVVGCDSGKRYRICKGQIFNVQELDQFGDLLCSWCFAPRGVPNGDANLAQKIALEGFERKTLAIANRTRARIC